MKMNCQFCHQSLPEENLEELLNNKMTECPQCGGKMMIVPEVKKPEAKLRIHTDPYLVIE